MNIENFCEKDQVIMREWFERNLPLVDGLVSGGEPIPPTCKMCYQKMLMEMIAEDIRTDTAQIVKKVVT